MVHGAVELVCPAGVREKSLDAFLHFLGGLLFSDSSGEPCGDFICALRKVFRDVIEDLRAVMGSGFAPALGLARGFNGVANIFAVAQRRFAQEFALFAANLNAVT